MHSLVRTHMIPPHSKSSISEHCPGDHLQHKGIREIFHIQAMMPNVGALSDVSSLRRIYIYSMYSLSINERKGHQYTLVNDFTSSMFNLSHQDLLPVYRKILSFICSGKQRQKCFCTSGNPCAATEQDVSQLDRHTSGNVSLEQGLAKWLSSFQRV